MVARRLGWLVTVIVIVTVTIVFGVGISGPATTDYRADVGATGGKSVVLDRVTIAYSDTGGSGPVLICLHAIGHGARDFDEMAHRLPGYRVIAIDFPGQGRSGDDHVAASGTRYAQLLALFIARLQLHDVVLLGNSIGGATAVRYTLDHPGNVRGLVLCDSGGILPPPDFRTRLAIGAFVQFFAAGERGAPWFGWAFAHYYNGVLKEAPAREERARIVRSAYETAPELTEAWRSFATPQESLWTRLPEIHCPVLFAWAKDDFVIPLDASRPAFARFRDRRLEVFNGGHAAFLEDPDRFLSVLKPFLARAEASSASP
jgi:4,5:9,10-diseco-3-hydroxy-5,9,17-trioxoandrosta-1(10),2-diene-4-oate hydrolase